MTLEGYRKLEKSDLMWEMHSIKLLARLAGNEIKVLKKIVIGQ